MKKVHIRIPLLTVLAVLATVLPAVAAGDVVNINSADVEELSMLPRVGPVVAERIVAFREENGPFKTAEDLLLVRGIGDATFEILRPHLALSGETTLTEKVKVERTASDDEG